MRDRNCSGAVAPHADSTEGPPDLVCLMISDVARAGVSSPMWPCAARDPDASLEVESWFSGTNLLEGREWTTRCQVKVADTDRTLGYIVGGKVRRMGAVQWEYSLRAVDRGRS